MEETAISLGEDVDRREAALAALLAETMADGPLWECVASFQEDDVRIATLAKRALELYERTSPILESRSADETAEPIDRAVGAVRQIADTLAMLSHPWSPDERVELGIPTRAVIELLIRLYDVDAWLADHGYPLQLPEGDVPPEGWPPPGGQVDITAADFIEHLEVALSSYEMVVNVRSTPESRQAIQVVEFRELACRSIGNAWGWVPWIRRHEPDGELAAAIHLWLAEASFIVAWEETTDNSLFPSKAFLKRVLTDTEAYEWLIANDANLPDWLS